MIVNLRKRFPNVRLAFVYDIVCGLVRHIKRHGDNELAEPEISAIDALHTYCHGICCQVSYGIRQIHGFGSFAGITAEQKWSAVGDVFASARLMTAENRFFFYFFALLYFYLFIYFLHLL